VPIRFHLDEHISSAVASALRHREIDVTTAAETGLIAAPDADHLAFASAAGRVLVTQDSDFLRLHMSGVPHAGIAYCQQQLRSTGELLRVLVLIHAVLSPEEMMNTVEFL
jgi:predicted nuclease of predicted toxin-antitoxin system